MLETCHSIRSEADLQDIFEQFGTVRESRVINDRETGRSRGFAFVTMGNDAEGQAAIATLHGKQFAGRTITVNEARPERGTPKAICFPVKALTAARRWKRFQCCSLAGMAGNKPRGRIKHRSLRSTAQTRFC